MRYAYEDLSEQHFERLVVAIGQRIFGIGLQGFAEGPDGGRDAKFTGEAERYPSTRSPWRGTTILQAKHTNGKNKSFSEADFYSENSNNTVMGEEIPRIRKLRTGGELENYMIVSNRRLTAGMEDKIKRLVSSQCDIPNGSVAVLGIEQLEQYLKVFPEAAEQADLDPIDCPLIVSPDDLAEVVEALADAVGEALNALDVPPVPRIPYDEKNAFNNMSPEYARKLRRSYLKDSGTVKEFLASPENERLLQMYEAAAEEFELKIVAKRRDFQTFDDVMNYLCDLLIQRDPVLRRHTRLTRLVVFYMYWNCDIGDEGDVETN